MLDEKTDNLNSENSTENSTSKPETDKSELGNNVVKDPLKNEESKTILVSENKKQEEVDVKNDSEKKEPAVKKPKKEKILVEDDDAKSKVIEPKSEDEVEVEKVDFSSYSLEELVKELEKLLKEESISTIKGEIEKIKQSFNKKYGELILKNKNSFLAEGGNEIDFHYSNPIKSVYNDLLFEFKTKRQNYYKQIEEEQKNNLAKKLELIDELKHLIDNAESSTMYHNFKEIQQNWSKVGNIPRTKYNDTWRTYHHHVERFYDLLHLNNDLRDLDFKHNLEEKLKLVEKAEELAVSNDLSNAFKELQVLHRLWKEEVGPVDRENREGIWERFSNATKIIHDKRHDLQKSLETKFEDNVVKKRER